MNLFEISVMSVLDLLGYLMISRKLISESYTNIKKKHSMTLRVIIFFSILMGIIGTTSFGKYSFIIGAVFTILFIYILYESFLYNLNRSRD